MTTATDVRIVRAGREHIPFVAWVVLAASRSHLERSLWDFVLGGDDEQKVLRYLEVLADTDLVHWAHYSLFLVAEMDGVPAAGLCGFFENEYGIGSLIAGAAEANVRTQRPPEEVAAGWERAKSIANIEQAHEPGTWVVEHVATKPEFRRRGLLERLMGEMVERGRQRGASVADIGVLIGNEPAQRAYEKCGFAAVEEKRDAEFEAAYGSPGGRLLRRAI
jgi:translation initiation factor 4G